MTQSNNYTWNACLVIRDEEDHIQSVIDAIKEQKPPPKRILVANDGSVDGTKKILDSISGIDVSHHKPYPHDYLSGSFYKIRIDLLKEAIIGADYVVCVDGDTILLNSYVEEIIKKMRHDGVVLACGQDSQDKFTLVNESHMVIDVKWLRKFQTLTEKLSWSASTLITYASLTGVRSAVYHDIHIEFKRTHNTKISKQKMEHRGVWLKKKGFSLWFVVLVAIRRRNLPLLKGYLSSRDECKDSRISWWNKQYQREKIFSFLGVRNSLLRRTGDAIYVEPRTPPLTIPNNLTDHQA